MTPSEVFKAQELVYELKVRDVMTRKLVTVAPETTMRELKTLMRDNRISGTPVVVGQQLVGIVSIEDLIVTLERVELDTPVSQHMTAHVYTVRDDESVVRAVKLFAQAAVGRLPVVDAQGQLVGILTRADITRGLLKALENAYHEEEVRSYRASHVFEDTASDRTSVILRYDVAVRDFDAAGHASSRLKHTLRRLGIDPRIVRRIAIASYEAEMNLVIHTDQGGSVVVEVTPGYIALLAADIGPGIPNVRQALEPGFSTAPDWIREMGFGAGMGLSNIQACVDEMHLDSEPGRGTRLTAIVYLNKQGETRNEAATDR